MPLIEAAPSAEVSLRSRRQAVIVKAPGRLADFFPPSSTTTSQVPGVALLTSISQVTRLAFEAAFVPMI